MKKFKKFTPVAILFVFMAFPGIGQILINSNATAEAASKTPEQVADVPADSKIRVTSDNSETYEAFVKFNISAVDAKRISMATVYTSAGQHNPSGVQVINPYWIDMYGSNTTEWPNPFTWNSSRSMHKSENILASENILGFGSNYNFGGNAVADWIKAKITEGATEVTFRFHAREEHPFDVWVNGTYQDGMELVIEYESVTDDPASYTDTLAKINFTYDNSFDEPGWINLYGTSSFPADLGNNISVSVSGNTLNPGYSGEPSTGFPENVGSTYNFIEQDNDNPVSFKVTGLNPDAVYRFNFFSSRDDDDVSDERTTSFYILSEGKTEGELLLFDETFTYDGSLNGFKWFDYSDIDGAPADLTTPFDYENGEVFERYEVVSQATSQKAALSFGIWQYGGDRETVSSQTFVSGPGSVGIRNSSPSTWWELDQNSPVDFSKPSNFLRLGFPLWSDALKLVSPWSSNGDWDKRNLYHPMTIHASVVAVPEGGSFSGWDYWLTRHKEASINSVGNTDSMLVLSAITPSPEGEIIIKMSKLAGNYGYINAMIISAQKTTQGNIISAVNEIEYFPVPVKNFLTITRLSGECTISVFNTVGSKVMEISSHGRDKLMIDMTSLMTGVYIVNVSENTSSEHESFKIIKQ